MKNLVHWQNRWNPFEEMDELHQHLNSLLGGNLVRCSQVAEDGASTSTWAPLVDIAEDDKEYLVKLEIPGVDKEDVSVKVSDGVLTVQGERKSEAEEKGKKYHRVERTYGSFTRRFTLPEDVDQGKVQAVFKNGVLHVSLVKSEEAKPKSIDVKIG